MPAGAQWEGIDLTSLTALRKASVALLIGAFAFSACGGGTATSAPTSGGAASVAPTTAGTTPPVVTPPPPSVTATQGAPTQGAKVDPADDLKIAAPYTLDPLSEQIAGVFVTAMEQAVSGPMADVVQFGFRTATKDGATQAWVIVMAFPGVPIGGSALLDQIVQGAMAGGGTSKEIKVGGKDARLVEQGGQAFVIMVNGDEFLMIVGTAKAATLDVAGALAEAN